MKPSGRRGEEPGDKAGNGPRRDEPVGERTGASAALRGVVGVDKRRVAIESGDWFVGEEGRTRGNGDFALAESGRDDMTEQSKRR